MNLQHCNVIILQIISSLVSSIPMSLLFVTFSKLWLCVCKAANNTVSCCVQYCTFPPPKWRGGNRGRQCRYNVSELMHMHSDGNDTSLASAVRRGCVAIPCLLFLWYVHSYRMKLHRRSCILSGMYCRNILASPSIYLNPEICRIWCMHAMEIGTTGQTDGHKAWQTDRQTSEKYYLKWTTSARIWNI